MTQTQQVNNAEKYVGINKFCDSIKELTEGYQTITVYFNSYSRSIYYDNQVNIKPIGFTLNDKDTPKYVRYYEVNKLLPQMKFIKFTETKSRKLDSEPQDRKLYRLIIAIEETVRNKIKYHNSKILDGNEELTEKLLQNYKEDKNTIVEEQNELIEDDFGDINEIDPDSLI